MRWRGIALALAIVATAGFSGTATDWLQGAEDTGFLQAGGDAGGADSIDQAWCPVAGDPGPGVHAFAIDRDGMQRTYEVHVPPSYDGAVPAPMVIALHGFASGPAEMAASSGLDQIALLEGFVVAYPAGFEGSWNSGGCCGAASIAGVDDVGFVVAVARDAASRLCVDADRVYLAGTASGGEMAGRIAFERPGVFAAVTTIDGSDPLSAGGGAADPPRAADAAWEAWDCLSGR